MIPAYDVPPARLAAGPVHRCRCGSDRRRRIHPTHRPGRRRYCGPARARPRPGRGPAGRRRIGDHSLRSVPRCRHVTVVGLARRVAAPLRRRSRPVPSPWIRSTPGRGVLARYERWRSPLDLGPTPARVRSVTRISYVPAAAAVVRVAALAAVGGFDVTLRFGEDVDLVWRLDAAWMAGPLRAGVDGVVHHRDAPSACGLAALQLRIVRGTAGPPPPGRPRCPAHEPMERRGVGHRGRLPAGRGRDRRRHDCHARPEVGRPPASVAGCRSPGRPRPSPRRADPGGGARAGMVPVRRRCRARVTARALASSWASL